MSKQKPGGKPPAVVLIRPKFAHNVGAALRACSCFGMRQLWYTGNRFQEELELKKRLPREERMKGYKDVELCACDYPFERFQNVVPIAVELREGATPLTYFEHPENALYIFGPEDGSLSHVEARHCHQFVIIPSAHCLNLAAAVNVVLYDRRAKRQMLGLEPVAQEDILREHRGML